MTHAQKPDLVFLRNGRVHLNWWGRQFSRLLAAEVCASAVVMVVMLDTPCSEVECKTTGYPLHSHFSPFTSPTVRHRVSSHFNWTLLFMVFISLVSVLNLLYFYISTFRSVCAVPNMAVFCSSFTSCFPGMLLTFIIIIIIIIFCIHVK